MRILLTNHALAERSGTELYLRDLALELLRRGHQPIAYSRRLGDVADELRKATVPVVGDLRHLDEPPDLIHAQHHLEAMTALATFPETPAVYVCHGWLPAAEAPPEHPRIARYVAVDELVRQRLREECGLAEERVRRLLNFIDLERFAARPPLPPRLKRALVFSNYVSEENCLDALRHACLDAGLELDVIGRGHGTPAEAPESRLGDYDLVFAKGRSALEAAAVGAAVILCDVAGLGPLVTSRELDELRAYNFGVRLLREPVTADRVLDRLAAYDADDAAEVSRRLRAEAGLESYAPRLLEIYAEALAEASPRAASTSQLHAASRAIAAYLRHGPLTGGDVHAAEREALLADAAHHKARAAELRLAADRLRARRERGQAERDALQAQLTISEARAAAEQRAARELERRLEEIEDRRRANREQLDAARRDIDQLRLQIADFRTQVADLERARLDGQHQTQVLSEGLERKSAELTSVQRSMTWRLRAAVLRLPGPAALYRRLRRLCTPGSPRRA